MKSEARKYLEFVEEFERFVRLMTEGEDVSVTFKRADREEGRKEDYIELAMPTGQKGIQIQRFHVEDIYESYCSGRTMEEIVKEASKLIDQCGYLRRNNPLEHLDEYELIASSLVLRPLNYVRKQKKLEGGIFELNGDIALALYVNIGNYQDVYTSSMVPREMFKRWNRNRKDVLDAAKKNTLRLFPPRIFKWYSSQPGSDDSYCSFMNPEDKPLIRKGPFGTFITTENKCNGAVAIFLPGVAKRLGELLKNDFYIAFTSMHESVIHDCSTVDPDNIRESLKHMNQELPSEEDFLSENPYYYNRVKDCITMLEE